MELGYTAYSLDFSMIGQLKTLTQWIGNQMIQKSLMKQEISNEFLQAVVGDFDENLFLKKAQYSRLPDYGKLSID